jgi:drug/metabolite transporter superfamily protein YnfA
MNNLRTWIIISWIALPSVMFGGYSLLRLLIRGNILTPFQVTYFRAGHAHAGVLLVMSLLYYTFLEQTALSASVKLAACVALLVGILAQSGGFFLHMLMGQPNTASIGTTVTTVGAVLLAGAILALVYGLMTTPA